MSVAGLRSRARACIRLSAELWKKRLKTPGGAMLRCIEISERGLVHIHIVYYGPTVDSSWLTSTATKLYRRSVRASVKPIKGGKRGVAKVTRYAAKGVKGTAAAFDEDFLTGEKSGTLLHPELAARWEVAVHSARLIESYGALRGLEVPHPEDDGGPHNDIDVQCSCGAVGRWTTVYRCARDFLMECHWGGKAGLEGNRWLPYWMRQAVWEKQSMMRRRAR